jgi:hypothetical protein
MTSEIATRWTNFTDRNVRIIGVGSVGFTLQRPSAVGRTVYRMENSMR